MNFLFSVLLFGIITVAHASGGSHLDPDHEIIQIGKDPNNSYPFLRFPSSSSSSNEYDIEAGQSRPKPVAYERCCGLPSPMARTLPDNSAKSLAIMAYRKLLKASLALINSFLLCTYLGIEPTSSMIASGVLVFLVECLLSNAHERRVFKKSIKGLLAITALKAETLLLLGFYLMMSMAEPDIAIIFMVFLAFLEDLAVGARLTSEFTDMRKMD